MDIGKNDDSDSDATFCDFDFDMVLDSSNTNEDFDFARFSDESNILEDFQAEAHETEQLPANNNNSGTAEKLGEAPLCESENNSHTFAMGIQYGQVQERFDMNYDSDCEDVFSEKNVNVQKHSEISDQRMSDGDMDTNDSDIAGSKVDPEVDAMEKTFRLYMKIEYSDKLTSNSSMEQCEIIHVEELCKKRCSNAETVCTDDRESSVGTEYGCQSLVEPEQHLATIIRKPCDNHTTNKDIKYPALRKNQLSFDDRGERQKIFNETGGRLLLKNGGDIEEELSSLPHDSLPLKNEERSIKQEGKRNKDTTNEMNDSLRFQHDRTTVEKGVEVSLQCLEPIALEDQQNFDAEDTMTTVQSKQNLIVSTSSEPYADKIIKKHFLQNEQITVHSSNTETFRKTLCQRKEESPETQSLTTLKDHASVQQSVTNNKPSFSWTIQTRANALKDCNKQVQGKSVKKTKKVVRGSKCVKRLKCDLDSDADSPSSVDEKCRRPKIKQVAQVALTNSKKGLSQLELQQVNKHYSELQEMNDNVSGWLNGWGEPLSRETALRYLDDAKRIEQHSNRLIRTDKENFRLQEVLQVSESLELILDVAIKECDTLELIEEQELAGLGTEDENILESGEPIRCDNNADDGNSFSKKEELRKSSEEGNCERSSSEITDNFNSLSLEITKDKPAQIDREEATSFTELNEVPSNDAAIRLKSILRVANRQDTVKKHVQLDSPVTYYEPEAFDECIEQDSALVEDTGTQNLPLFVKEQTNATVSHRFIEHDAQIDYQEDQGKYEGEDRMTNLPVDKTGSLSTSKHQSATPRSTPDESPTLSPSGGYAELSKVYRQTVVSIQTQLKDNSKQDSKQGCIHHSPSASKVEEAQAITSPSDHNETQDRSTKLLIHSVNHEIKNSQLFFDLTDQECVSDSLTELNESVVLNSVDCTQYSPADKCTAMLTTERCETEYAIENVMNQETQSILGVECHKYVQPCQQKSKGNVELCSEEDYTQYSPADNFVRIESTTKSQGKMQDSFKINKKQLNASDRNVKPQPIYTQNYDHQPEMKANVILTSEEDCTQYGTKSSSHFNDTHLPAIIFRDGGDAGEKRTLMTNITDTNLPSMFEPLRGGGDADIKSISIDHINDNHSPAMVEPLRSTGAIKKRDRRVNIANASKISCASNPALVSVLSKDLDGEQANCSVPNMETETKSKGVLRKASMKVLKDNLLGKKLLEKQNIRALSPSSSSVLRKADNGACDKQGAMENMQTIDSLDLSLDLFTAYPAECNESQQETDLFLSDMEIASNVSIAGITHVRIKSPGEFMPMSDMPEAFWEGKNSVAINDWFKTMELW